MRIWLEHDDRRIEAFLAADLGWSAYLLADLSPSHRPYARFYLAAREDDEALVAVYAPPAFTVLVSMGTETGVAALLDAMDLPARAAVVIPREHLDVFGGRYRAGCWELMRRMVLTGAAPERGAAVLLGSEDMPAVLELLGEREGFAPFTAEMLREGVYVGVRRSDGLVAIAGTHIVAPERRIAAIGNVFTAPPARGQGLAKAVTAAVVHELLGRGYETIVLNVAADNHAAISVYERLGFTTACEFWEAGDAERI